MRKIHGLSGALAAAAFLATGLSAFAQTSCNYTGTRMPETRTLSNAQMVTVTNIDRPENEPWANKLSQQKV